MYVHHTESSLTVPATIIVPKAFQAIILSHFDLSFFYAGAVLCFAITTVDYWSPFMISFQSALSRYFMTAPVRRSLISSIFLRLPYLTSKSFSPPTSSQCPPVYPVNVLHFFVLLLYASSRPSTNDRQSWLKPRPGLSSHGSNQFYSNHLCNNFCRIAVNFTLAQDHSGSSYIDHPLHNDILTWSHFQFC